MWNPHKNQQQTTSKSNNVFLKHSTTFETSFFFKKKFQKQLFAEKTILTKFQEVLKTTFCRKNNFYKVSRSFKNNFEQTKQLKETFENDSSNLPASVANNKFKIKLVLMESMYALTDLWTQYDDMFSCCIVPQAIYEPVNMFELTCLVTSAKAWERLACGSSWPAWMY